METEETNEIEPVPAPIGRIGAPLTAAQQKEHVAAARAFAIEAARLASNTRCHNIVILDMAGVSVVTDFYVIATGTSARQMRSVCDDVDELAGKHGFKSLHLSGYEGETWIAIDFVDVVLHVFSQDARQYYDLENLWGDAKQVTWREEIAAKV